MSLAIRSDALGQEFVLLPVGESIFGSNDGWPSEKPRMGIKLDSELWFSVRPVTQSVWSAVMGINPSRFQSGFEAGLRPVERIDWSEAAAFGQHLSDHLSDGWHSEGIFRLPSEAEWEYAARAGTDTQWYCGDQDSSIHDHIWNAGNSGATTRMVGQKNPNPWGIHDICGNVSEWCLDNWFEDHSGRTNDCAPRYGGDESRRVHRGGSWFMESESTRCAARASSPVDRRSDGLGLRLVWEPL